MFKNIMIAVDGSAYTESVLQHAVALSKQFASRIHVLTVVDVRIFEWASAIGADGFVTVVPSGVYQDESLSILDEKCVKILEKCSRLLTEEKVNFKTEKVIGSRSINCWKKRKSPIWSLWVNAANSSAGTMMNWALPCRR